MRSGRGVLLLAVATFPTYLPAAPERDEPTLAGIAEIYRTADRQRAVTEVARWSRETLETEVKRLAGLAKKDNPDPSATRLAAVVLLTEMAVRDLHAGASQRTRWEILSAASLIQTSPPSARAAVFERRFYLLAALALQTGGYLDSAHTLLLDAFAAVGTTDAELLTALGAIVESVAALRQYDDSGGSPGDPRRPVGYGTETGGGGSLPSPSLAAAEARYKQAVALDPHLAEALLRLGRVRLLRGRTDEALRDLDRAAAATHQPGQRYLARLFEGRALESRSDLRGAAAAYRAAVAEVPKAQTALLALGRALDRLGDEAGSQEALEGASSSGGPYDPWWAYLAGQPARIDGLLEELRRLVP